MKSYNMEADSGISHEHRFVCFPDIYGMQRKKEEIAKQENDRLSRQLSDASMTLFYSATCVYITKLVS